MYTAEHNYLVIDNFLEEEVVNPLIENFRSMKFYDLSATTPIRGRRSKRLNTYKNLKFRRITKKLRQIQSSIDISSVRVFHLYLHKLCKQHLEEGYDIEVDAWHKDAFASYVYAGVLYLNKNPEPNTGTLLNINGDTITVENRFNRLVLYSADILHRVQNANSSEQDPRLTLTIFGKRYA